jgi:DNA-binding NtrC family response regulator
MGWSDLLLLLSDTLISPEVNSMGSAWAIKRQVPDEIPFAFRHDFSAATWPLGVVVVSGDAEIQAAIAEILRGCSLTSVPANGFAELKSIYSEAAPIACLCGFNLADGTFLDVVDFMDEQTIHVPVIMISPRSLEKTPACFVQSLRAGALATICYPYRLSDVQLMLWSVIQHQHETRQQVLRAKNSIAQNLPRAPR